MIGSGDKVETLAARAGAQSTAKRETGEGLKAIVTGKKGPPVFQWRVNTPTG
ncbi:hypothetical protein [Trichloromonas sp.]|uniref:hypothetical protein n=1 Tax=Trichloromonas sp. TaxID=3069249 RepID=UPI002A442099|nr:hypothetical protein [Trichloromonas sp.]